VLCPFFFTDEKEAKSPPAPGIAGNLVGSAKKLLRDLKCTNRLGLVWLLQFFVYGKVWRPQNFSERAAANIPLSPIPASWGNWETE